MENTIFVQIASYRDPELKPTLKDLFEKADNPDLLRVCIAHQHSVEDTWDTLEEYKDDFRVKVIDIPHEQSKGACWARNTIQQYYNNEKYTLQLDSHHRFIKGWDTECIQMIEQLQNDGYPKPLLTGYIPSYDPKNDPKERVNTPWKMNFDRFTPEGVLFFLPSYMNDFEELTAPIPSRFYSAHFCFTLGKFAEEVQHDPTFYFHGEEITITVRAYTHGYDLFHPHKVIAWHEYTRAGRTKHWDDSSNWDDLNKRTHGKTRSLLGVDGEICSPCNIKAFGKYYLGTERTLNDYEKYAGIRFKDRSAQQYTLDGKLPPNPIVEDFDASFIPRFKHAIDLNPADFPLKDYEFAAVIFEDKFGNSLHRQDESGDQFQNKVNGSESFTLWRQANIRKPYKWIVWGYSKSQGWSEKVEKVM